MIGGGSRFTRPIYCKSSKSLEGDRECDDAAFQRHFKKVDTRNCSLIKLQESKDERRARHF